MSARAWSWIGGYLAIGVVLLLWSNRNPERHPFLRAIPAALAEPILSGCLFPITGVLGIALWPLLVVLDLIAPFLRLDARSSRRDEPDVAPEIGSVGVCVTALKPSGKIQIGDERFDATCVKDFLPEGSRVRIVKKQAFNVIVERIV